MRAVQKSMTMILSGAPRTRSAQTPARGPARGLLLRFRSRLLARRERRNLADRLLHMVDRDQPRAFELTRRVLVSRAVEEVLVVEAMVRVVPAAVAGVI